MGGFAIGGDVRFEVGKEMGGESRPDSMGCSTIGAIVSCTGAPLPHRELFLTLLPRLLALRLVLGLRCSRLIRLGR